MFDLDLIERGFSAPIGTETHEAAKSEFAKLRKAIEEAPAVKLNSSSFLCNRGRVGNADNIKSPHIIETPPGFDRARVLLVKCDD